MLLAGKRRNTIVLVIVLVTWLNSYGDCTECVREDTPKIEDDTQDCKEINDDILGGEIPVKNEARASINSSTGELEVTFLVSNRIEKYWVALIINNNATTRKACIDLDAGKNDGDIFHSVQEFNTNKCMDTMGLNTTKNWDTFIEDKTPNRNVTVAKNTGVCFTHFPELMVGYVTFKYVYTGCYRIQLEDGNDIHRAALRPTFYATEYSKRIIQPIEPEISLQSFPSTTNGRKNIQLVMRYEVLNKEKLPVSLSLKKRLNEDSCLIDEGEKLAFWELSINEDNSLMCKRKDQTEYSYHCDWNNDIVTCLLENFQYGPYCITVTPVDQVRCSIYTVWASEHCTRYYILNVTGVLPQQHSKVEGSNDKFIIILTCGLAAVCCLLIVVVVVISCSRENHDVDPLKKPVPQFSPDVQPQILLLYAQDCKEFMTLMVSFREFLKNVGKCEVLDCFDPDRAEEIAKSPVEWMCHWVSFPQVKVVVVVSDCAIAHQEAMIRGINLQYKEPIPNSHLFLYGLKEITYNQKRGDYNCTFVVRFSAKDLSYLTPYTRYELPSHLPYLLRNLNLNINLTELGECIELKKFIANHTELIKFEKQNPLYLNYLMFKSREVV